MESEYQIEHGQVCHHSPSIQNKKCFQAPNLNSHLHHHPYIGSISSLIKSSSKSYCSMMGENDEDNYSVFERKQQNLQRSILSAPKYESDTNVRKLLHIQSFYAKCFFKFYFIYYLNKRTQTTTTKKTTTSLTQLQITTSILALQATASKKLLFHLLHLLSPLINFTNVISIKASCSLLVRYTFFGNSFFCN